MLFSLIIPVYNRPDEVDELLDSLTRQTFGDFEVVVVDDGSTRPCREVAMRYASRLDLHYYDKPNSGPGPTRNYAAGHCKGEFLVLLDSDCLLPPGYLAAVDAELRRQPCDAFGGPDRAHPSFTPVQKAINYAMTSFFTTGGIRGGKGRRLDKFYPRSFNMGMRAEVYRRLGGFAPMRLFAQGGTPVACRLHPWPGGLPAGGSVVPLERVAACALCAVGRGRLYGLQPQPAGGASFCSRLVCAAHGLWQRFPACLVAAVCAWQGRVRSLQTQLL